MKTNRYFDFLCSLVGRSYEYERLLEELHGIEFYSLVPNDHNRGEDGKYIRHEFIDEVGPTGSPYLPQGECTILEMLIGLSRRLEFETTQSRWERTASAWFWILIDNLGLSDCTDQNYLECSFGDDKYVTSVINRMLSRDYEFDGNGGLFPLKYPQQDQRRVEIWYQMTYWVIENYPI